MRCSTDSTPVSSDASVRGNLKNMSAIVTCAIGPHEAYLPLIEPSLRAYAAKFGYEVLIHTTSADESRPPAWSKIRYLLDALSSHREVIWIDSDALIVDLSRDLRKDVDKKTDFAWVIHHFDDAQHPNSGVVFVRNTPRTIALLTAAYEQVDLIDHPWWEQAALIRLLGYSSEIVDEGQVREPMNVTVEHLDSSWNSIRQDRGNPVRIRHFAGDWHEVRALSMAELVLTHPGLDDVAGIDTARENAQRLVARTRSRIRQFKRAAAQTPSERDANS